MTGGFGEVMNNDAFNRIQIKRFGEEVTFQSGLTVKAIVEAESKSENVAQTQINNQTLLLYIRAIDLTEIINRHQKVIVRELTYQIVEIGDDMNGMAIFRVSRT